MFRMFDVHPSSAMLPWVYVEHPKHVPKLRKLNMYYTAQEVARHNGNEGTFWVIIHGDVHDVTPFLKEHPGGEEVLMDLAGKDGTECFEDIGHSPEARKLRMKYKIGEISEHPGGEEVLLEQAGKNATEAFEDVGHSSDAREMMKKYKIGELEEADRVKTDDKKTNKDWTPDSSEGSNSSWKAWLIPVALGILATLVYRFFILSQ